MDPYAFRQLCGRFATGIVVLTARDPHGAPLGMTMNSFTSVSLDPPLIALAVGHEAQMHSLLLTTTHLAVNILAIEQEALARRFAAGLPERFDGVGWQPGPTDEVLLDGALAHLYCTRWDTVPVGDHTLLIARVTGGSTAAIGGPLLYYRGSYAEPDSL